MGLMASLSGCTDELEGVFKSSRPSDVICFTTSLSDSRGSSVSRGSSGHLAIEQEEWLVGVSEKQDASRKAPVTLLSGSAGVIGYGDDEETPWSNNAEYVFDGDELTAKSTDVRWGTIASNQTVSCYVYAPYNNSNIAGKTINYQVKPVVTEQQDLIVASWQGSKGTNYGENIEPQTIPLVFEHALTAVKFKVGFACTVKELRIEGIYNSGVYTFGSGWDVTTSGDNPKSNYSFTFGTDGAGTSLIANASLTDGDNTLMMIPQTLSDASKVILTTTDHEPIEIPLQGKVWQPGKMITYTIHKDKAPATIYFDLAAGNVTINATTYKGAYFQTTIDAEGNPITSKVEITDGEHQSGNSYYVYQSTSANKSTTGKMGDTFVLPQYREVTVTENGVTKTWSDFITNNTDVNKVIQAWDNAAGAGKATAADAYANSPNQSGSAGAVRDVGREATKNRIHITGNVGTVNLFIDNIYSSYQQRGSSSPVRTRTEGGISFIPLWTAGNSVLTINIIGDNRLGCVNYQNTKKTRNSLVFEGTGSLTVADVDYFRDGSGLGSNRSCSVIGGKDNPASEEDVYNIVFNSGVIYAGAVPSTCTAIGGGGNGNTNITINGGTITAVARTTGTAIGGGTGLVQPGGEGIVTINDGNVYAYNYKNSSEVPSSAIGGAGSQDVAGSLGNVSIHGGYVYAYSEYGTAIGAGSSQKTQGGDAVVTITGGQVIAKSGSGAGIGGGSSYTMGGSTGTVYDGGTATINISGNPIIRTGSIGGGTTGHKQGRIGSANITIGGGDIQAQFVMEAGSTEPPKFTMSGGTIRNSNVDDVDYIHIKKNGGAVFLGDGTFTMTGGTIKNCSAVQGGAVYIERRAKQTDEDDEEEEFNFTMTDGEIHSCFATGKDATKGHGGAVYLNGGQVLMTGGTIYNNYSVNGDGGAVYISNGNFFMQDGLPEISGNSAQKGSGGGVFVSSAGSGVQVNLLRGLITGNSANNNGGGVCVDMEETAHAASVIVGKEKAAGEEEVNTTPNISGNAAMLSGGGLYVRGANANITINGGNIKSNQVSAYVKNENVANEGGEVTLNAENVTDIVRVTFNANGGYKKGASSVTEYEQKIVINTNSKLAENQFEWGGKNFVRWNNRPDNLGDISYDNGAKINISKDITLYAIWKDQ